MVNKIKFFFLSTFNQYVFIWIFINVLYNFRLIKIYDEYSFKLFWFFITSMFFFVIGYFFYKILKKKIVYKKDKINSDYYTKIAKFNLKFWSLLFLFEIIQQNGFPLLWLFNGDPREYFDFGIPSLHGFIQAFYLISANLFFYLGKYKKSYYLISFFHLIMPLMIISRALLLFTLFSLLINYLISINLNLKKSFKILIFLLGFLFMFSYIGNNRGGEEVKDLVINNFYDIADDSIEKSNFNDIFLPVYIYTTIGINNINYNLIDNHKPKFTFEQSYTGLVPSFIRNMLFPEVEYEEKYGLKLAINSFNVFTCFGTYFYDFGFLGVAWHSFFLGIIASRFRINRIRNLFDTISFSAISFAIIASPFWDFVMNWFFIGTLIVCSYYSKKYHQKCKLV